MKQFFQRIMCKIGHHKWGEGYACSDPNFLFGYGHEAKDCQREGCNYVKRTVN